MLHDNILLILLLLFAVSVLIMVGQKLRISYPIFFGHRRVGHQPDSGYAHHQHRPRNRLPHFFCRRSCTKRLGIPPETVLALAPSHWHRRPSAWCFYLAHRGYISQAMIPALQPALGFLLGGIISPPDAVAAQSVLKTLKVPKRALTILEGESLVNDASRLDRVPLLRWPPCSRAILYGKTPWANSFG